MMRARPWLFFCLCIYAVGLKCINECRMFPDNVAFVSVLVSQHSLPYEPSHTSRSEANHRVICVGYELDMIEVKNCLILLR